MPALCCLPCAAVRAAGCRSCTWPGQAALGAQGSHSPWPPTMHRALESQTWQGTNEHGWKTGEPTTHAVGGLPCHSKCPLTVSMMCTTLEPPDRSATTGLATWPPTSSKPRESLEPTT